MPLELFMGEETEKADKKKAEIRRVRELRHNRKSELF